MIPNVVTRGMSYLIIRQIITIWQRGNKAVQKEHMDLIKYYVTVKHMETMS